MNEMQEYQLAKRLIKEKRYYDAAAIYENILLVGDTTVAESAYTLGVLCETGHLLIGSLEDRQNRAEKYYNIADGMGYDKATYALGSLLRRRGVNDRALTHFERVSSTNPSAAYWVARILKDRPELRPECSRQEYITMAAEQGHVLAQRELAEQHLLGRHGLIGILKGPALYVRFLVGVVKALRAEDKTRYT